MPAGKYVLELSDESSCSSVFSSEFEIPVLNVIGMDEGSAIARPTACSSNTGSITGIAVTGATNNEPDHTQGNIFRTTSQPELIAAPAGKYILKATNATCEKVSGEYTIMQLSPVSFPDHSFEGTSPTCGQNNGILQIMPGNGEQPVSLRWVDENDLPVGTQALVTDVDAGTFRLYLTDVNGCETLYNNYTLVRIPLLSLD